MISPNMGVNMAAPCVLFVLVTVVTGAFATVINGVHTDANHYPQTVVYGTCVGTLISDRWVLSAAHCYRRSDDHVIVFLDGTSHLVKRAITHPLYRLDKNRVNGTTTEIWATYDYLLLELDQPVRTGRYLKLEDGPEPPQGTRATFPSIKNTLDPNVLSACCRLGGGASNTGCCGLVAASHPGFHTFSIRDQSFMELRRKIQLLQGELYTLSDEECARRVQSFNPATMLCAAGGAPNHSGACYGDSGSGLVAEGKLLGVLSWVEHDAIDCGSDRVVVCARLSTQEIKDWMNSTMDIENPITPRVILGHRVL